MHRTQPANIDATYLNTLDYHDSHWEWSKWDVVVHLANVSPKWVQYNHSGRIIYASSGAVYAGTNKYADDKRKWEAMLEGKHVVARLFSFVGAHLKNLYAVTNFIDDAMNGRPIVVRSSGLSVRSYLYGEQLGQVMWSMLDKDPGIYDVGGKTPYTILEVARLVAQQFDAYLQVLNEHDSTDSIYLPEYGIEETIPLDEAIERTIHER